MLAWLKHRWHDVCDSTIGTEVFWELAVDHRSARQVLEPLIDLYASGMTLDLGAGRLVWRPMLSRHATRYVSADCAPTHPGLDLQFDIQQRFPLEDCSVHTLFCCSVLEHVAQPWSVLAECRRILVPGGHLLLFVPFLYHLHGAPEDYYRFSPFGVKRLAEEAGFEVTICRPTGGLGHSLLHAVSMLTTSLVFSHTWPEPAAAIARALTAAAGALDALDRDHVFAQNVVAVLRRPLGGERFSPNARGDRPS
jgi:SAM-dependent methyltransferase